MSEYLNPLDQILDDDNMDDVVLYNAQNIPIRMEQIARLMIEEKMYVILKPIMEEPLIGADECLVFCIDEVDEEDVLVLVTDDELLDKVFDEYEELLREEGLL